MSGRQQLLQMSKGYRSYMFAQLIVEEEAPLVRVQMEEFIHKEFGQESNSPYLDTF